MCNDRDKMKRASLVTSNDCQGVHRKPKSRTQMANLSIQFLSDPWLPYVFYDSQLKMKASAILFHLSSSLSVSGWHFLLKKEKSTIKNRPKYYICICNPKTLTLMMSHPQFWYQLCEIEVRSTKRLTLEVRTCLLCDMEHLDDVPG